MSLQGAPASNEVLCETAAKTASELRAGCICRHEDFARLSTSDGSAAARKRVAGWGAGALAPARAARCVVACGKTHGRPPDLGELIAKGWEAL